MERSGFLISITRAFPCEKNVKVFLSCWTLRAVNANGSNKARDQRLTADRLIRVCISHQSDYRITVCISHQSYHSIWISCTNHSVWVLFSCKWCHGIKGLCTKNDTTRTFGLIHLRSVMVCGIRKTLVD